MLSDLDEWRLVNQQRDLSVGYQRFTKAAIVSTRALSTGSDGSA